MDDFDIQINMDFLLDSFLTPDSGVTLLEEDEGFLTSDTLLGVVPQTPPREFPSGAVEPIQSSPGFSVPTVPSNFAPAFAEFSPAVAPIARPQQNHHHHHDHQIHHVHQNQQQQEPVAAVPIKLEQQEQVEEQVKPASAEQQPASAIMDEDDQIALKELFLSKFTRSSGRKTSSSILQLTSMMSTFGSEFVWIERDDQGFLELCFHRDALINALKNHDSFTGLVFTSFERGLKHQGLRVTCTTHGKTSKVKRWGFKNPQLVFTQQERTTSSSKRKRQQPESTDDLLADPFCRSAGFDFTLEAQIPRAKAQKLFTWHQMSSDAHLKTADRLWTFAAPQLV